MKYIYIVIVSLFFFALLPAFTQEQLDLKVVYPKNNANINAPSTFFIGSTNPKAKLTIDNNEVKVYPNGGFVKVLDLKRGTNRINIETTLENRKKVLVYTINVPEYEKTMPHSPLKIDKATIKPDKDLTYMSADVINVSFKGATGNKASFSIGDIKDIPMTEIAPAYSKTPVVFGESFDASKQPIKGIYNGIYKIQECDNFKNEAIIIKLSSEDTVITQIADAKISIMPKDSMPVVANIIKDKAVIRNAPDQSRLTPLSKGTKINITGKIGSDYRFKMGENLNGWISENNVEVLPAGTPIAQSVISSIKVESASDGVLIKIPLAEKLPISIEELPDSRIALTVYGGISDINLIPYSDNDSYIKEIKWKQPYSDTFQLFITSNSKYLWGYEYYYEDDTLVLKLRKPPLTDANNPLKDKIIAIDPGHGGNELGSVGPTGIPEKTVNLAIAGYLKKMLENNGAKVVMTRNSDNETVGLYERINIANKYNSHILISIHNNALPDGRDPYKEHGSSVYYYHSQALPLAKSIQNSLVGNLGFNNYGIFWSSLALTRPHEPLAVLVEVGFMINPDEYALLVEKDFQKKAADAIYQGLEKFFKDSALNI